MQSIILDHAIPQHTSSDIVLPHADLVYKLYVYEYYRYIHVYIYIYRERDMHIYIYI